MQTSSWSGFLVGSIPALSVAAGVVVALVWRARMLRRGLRPTAVRSVLAVFNGVAVGLALGILVFLVLVVALASVG